MNVLAVRIEELPLGRLGYSRDIAYGTLYLAFDESVWITVIEPIIDGGITAKSPETGRPDALRKWDVLSIPSHSEIQKSRMLCRNCNRETLQGAAFCTHCGTAVRYSCPSCQTDNPPEGRYCYSCGTSLLVDYAQEPDVPTSPPEAYCVDEAYRIERPFQVEGPNRSGARDSTQNGQMQAVQPGGFWIRFVGELIDIAILLIPSSLLFLIVPFVGDFLLNAAYYIGFWVLWGAMPGKRLLGLSIERPDGSRMGPGRCVARYSASLLGVGYIMNGLREDKRGVARPDLRHCRGAPGTRVAVGDGQRFLE